MNAKEMIQAVADGQAVEEILGEQDPNQMHEATRWAGVLSGLGELLETAQATVKEIGGGLSPTDLETVDQVFSKYGLFSYLKQMEKDMKVAIGNMKGFRRDASSALDKKGLEAGKSVFNKRIKGKIR